MERQWSALAESQKQGVRQWSEKPPHWREAENMLLRQSNHDFDHWRTHWRSLTLVQILNVFI